MWFQHDSAPAHYGRNVRSWAERNLLSKMYSRPHSSVVKTLDFYLWDCLKEKVSSGEELIQRIYDYIFTLSKNFATNNLSYFERHCRFYVFELIQHTFSNCFKFCSFYKLWKYIFNFICDRMISSIVFLVFNINILYYYSLLFS